MTNIYIIDDEIHVRKWLSFCISHMQDFQVAGESSNVKDGLAQLAKISADILILDIMMPGMNGLDAIQKIKALYPGLSIIMLTNYAEFEYIQKAVRSGAEEYFLKSELTEEDLAACLEKIALKKRTSSVPYQDYDLLTLQNLGTQIINHTISNKEQFLKVMESYPNLHVFAQNLMVFAIRHDKSIPVRIPEKDFPAISPYLSTAFVLPCISGLTLVACEMNKLRSGLALINALSQFACWIADNIHYHYIGISNVYYSAADFYPAVTEALLAMQYGFYKKPGTITYIWDTSPDPLKHEAFGSFEQDLLRLAKLEDWESISQTLTAAFTYLKKTMPLDLPSVIRSLQNLTYLLLSSHLQEKSGSCFPDAVLKEINTFTDCMYLDELKEKMESLIKKRSLGAARPHYSQPVLEALTFVNENLTENLTLTDLAKQIHINADYLGKIFKKEVGMSYNTYLTEKKMEYADYLLRTTNLKKYEIANKLGYGNFSYFSRIFNAYKNRQHSLDG